MVRPGLWSRLISGVCWIQPQSRHLYTYTRYTLSHLYTPGIVYAQNILSIHSVSHLHIYTLYTISQSPGIPPISQYKYTPSILTQCTVQLWIILSWYIPNIKSGILHAKLYLYSRSVPNRLIQAALLDKYWEQQSNIEHTQIVKTDLLPVCFFQFDQRVEVLCQKFFIQTEIVKMALTSV